MKKYLAFALLALPLQSFALSDDTTTKIMTPINNMFDAMREHDGAKLKQQFTTTAILERAKNDGSVSQTDIAKFAEFISKTEKHLDEKLFNVSVHKSDNVATAWTPFAFYLDGKLSHCGINSFQLIQLDGEWKIQYLIDNAHPGDCKKFISF